MNTRNSSLSMASLRRRFAPSAAALRVDSLHRPHLSTTVAFIVAASTAISGCSRSPEGDTATNSASSRSPNLTGERRAAQPRDAKAAPNVKAAREANAAWDAWIKATGEWVQGKSAPQTATTSTRTLKPVYVDVMAVATRHPAWQLAEALERGSTQLPGNAAAGMPAISVPSINLPGVMAAGTPALPRLPRAAAELSDEPFEYSNDAPSPVPFSSNGAPAPLSLPPLSVATAAQRQTAPGLGLLQDYAARRQSAAIDEFMNLAATGDDRSLAGRAADLRAALEEGIEAEVERLRREALSPSAPSLPPADVQLEMTNLRLRVQNPNLTVSQRQEARAQLDALVAQWRDTLRTQEEATLAQLEQSRRDLPEQRRRQGSVRINKIVAGQRAEEEGERQTVRARLFSLLEEDFEPGDATLGIELPAVTLPGLPSLSSLVEGASSAGRRATARSGRTLASTRSGLSRYQLSTKYETSPAGAASIAGIGTSLTAPLPGQAAQSAATRSVYARALRERALREARLWTQFVAHRNGWKLQQNRAAPANASKATPPADGTRTVLQILSFT